MNAEDDGNIMSVHLSRSPVKWGIKVTETDQSREDFGETSASSTSWTVDRDAKEVVFALSDASGEITFSGMSLSLYQRTTYTDYQIHNQYVCHDDRNRRG
jgi:hypothetical protein